VASRKVERGRNYKAHGGTISAHKTCHTKLVSSLGLRRKTSRALKAPRGILHPMLATTVRPSSSSCRGLRRFIDSAKRERALSLLPNLTLKYFDSLSTTSSVPSTPTGSTIGKSS